MKNETLKYVEEGEFKDTRRWLRVRHLQVAMLFLCATTLYVVRSSMGVAVLAMTDASRRNDSNVQIFEWSENVHGLILSSFFWGYTLLQIPAGVLAKRFGGKPLLLAALLCNGLLCLAMPMLAKFGGWQAVCMMRAVMGLTQASFMPCTHTLIGKWAPPRERTRSSSIAYAGIPIGIILAMPLCGYLAQSALGWKMIFYCMGALSLSTAALWAALAGSSPADHRLIDDHERIYIEKSLLTGPEDASNAAIPWRQILTSRPLYALACAQIGFNWCFVFFLVENPTYMKNVLGINLADSSTLSALPFAAQWLATIVCGFVCQYLYNNKILTLTACRKLFNTVASVGVAVGLVTLSFLRSEQNVAAVVVLTATVGILAAGTCGFMLNHIDLAPNFGGVMLSITNCVANLVGILGPIFTSYVLGDNLRDISGWRVVFFVSAGLILACNLTFVLFGTAEQQPWNDPSNARTCDVRQKCSAKEEELLKLTAKLTPQT